MRFGERFPVRLRLGAGALISQARSVRTGAFMTRAGGATTRRRWRVIRPRPSYTSIPRPRSAIKIGDHFEIGAGVQGLILIAPDAPSWADDDNPSVVVEGDGLSSYCSDETTMGTMVFVVPTLSARASF